MIRGERVDLSRIRASLMTVIAEGDHITPPCQSQTIQSKVSSKDKELFRIPGGHIGIMAGSGASKHTWPHIDAWLAPAPNSAASPCYSAISRVSANGHSSSIHCASQ